MSIEWIIKILQDNLPMFLRGAGMTLLISIIGTLIGTLIGLLVGVIRTIPVPERGIKKVFLKIINIILSIYIEFFRGTPMIVQAMVIFYGSAQAFGIDINKIVAGLFIVSINTGAYMSEIVRGGIVSIDKGQFEGAEVLGLSKKDTFFRIIMPQALKRIFPPVANEIITLVKDTALVYVVGLDELLKVAKIASNRLSSIMPFVVIGVVYLLFNGLITKVLESIEKRFSYYQ